MPASLHRSAVLAGLCAALLPAGCSAAPDMAPVDAPPPAVRLIDAGAGATAPVRWADDGAEQDVVVSVLRGVNQRVAVGGDSVSDAALPDTTMDLPLQAQVTGGGAERAVDVELGEPSGSDHDLNDDLATAAGFRLSWTGDDRGAVSDMAFGAPDGASETARAGVEASLRQWASLPIVFPEEAIGPGARWTVTSDVDDLGVSQELAYRMVRRDGDTVELAVEVRQTPTTTELRDAGGASLHVVDSGTETMAGRLTVDLTRPLPVAGEVRYLTSIGYGGADRGGAGADVVQEHLRGVTFRRP